MMSLSSALFTIVKSPVSLPIVELEASCTKNRSSPVPIVNLELSGKIVLGLLPPCAPLKKK